MPPDVLASDLAFAVECINRCANLHDASGLTANPTRRAAMRETARRLKAHADSLRSSGSPTRGDQG